VLHDVALKVICVKCPCVGQELEDGTVLLRLAHLYEAGEHKDLSALASVDLKRVFPDKKVIIITFSDIHLCLIYMTIINLFDHSILTSPDCQDC
jgi:hypothetical protein